MAFYMNVQDQQETKKQILELEAKLKETESKMLAIRVQYILMRADRNRLKEELSEKN